MKKLISMILSLAMLASAAVTALPVSAEVTPGSILEDGYKFTDIARSSSGTYVAMSKSSDLNYARLYYSNDGINWTKSTNQPLVNNAATIYCNKNSQQQLVWWDSKGVFVAHGAASSYTSTDGVTWTKSAGLYKSANSMQTVSGNNLILGLSKSVNSTNDLTAATFPNENYIISDTDFYSMSIAAKPADEAGDTTVFVNGYQRTFDLTLAEDGGWIKEDENSGNGTQAPYDMVYAAAADTFLSVDGSETLMAAKDCRNTGKYTVSEGVNVTGINANDNYIVVGMGNGKMYYTENTQAGITADTVWTEIPAAEGTTACSEPIKNIEFAPDGSFIALSETLIYKGNLREYRDINTIVTLETPQVEKSSIFDGVRLIGGTYSADLGMYMVYGDTTEPNDEGKYQGKIFISTDGGQNWENVYTGINFSYRSFNTDGSIKSYNEVRNGAVWWSGQQQFVISAGTGTGTDTTNYGLSLTSANGRDWEVIPQATTDLRNYCDLALSGDGSKIYTTNNGRQFRTYTAWNKESMTYKGITLDGTDQSWYMNQIVVSDDEDPAVLMIQDYRGAVRNNEVSEGEELDKWTKIGAIAGAGYMTDAVFSKNLNQFVVISNAGFRTTLLSKDASVLTQGPIVPGRIVCNAIDTDNETFMLAGKNGNIYTAPDTENFQKDVTTLETVAPTEGTEANTMNVTNVYKAEPGKFIATSSDNTNSDVLIISKNTADTYEYTKASDNVITEGLEANTTYNVSVKGNNKTSADYNFDMIIAIYGQDGTLIQVQKNNETLAAATDGKVTAKITSDSDLPADAVMKIFLWNSAQGMIPVQEVTTPFN